MHSDTAYAPFGEHYAASGTSDLSFTGQNQDTATGVYDFPARELGEVSGRWPSPDPLDLGAVNPGDPQTWNRYGYVRNSPLSLVDPSGMYPLAPAKGPACGGEIDCAVGGGSGDVILGNDIFDAISGEPGTYLYVDMYGNLSFGFSFDLYEATERFIEQGIPGTSGLTFEGDGFVVSVKDYGAGIVDVNGLIPELIALQAQYQTDVAQVVPARYQNIINQEMQGGSSFADALSVAMLTAQATGQTSWIQPYLALTVQYGASAEQLIENSFPPTWPK